MVEHGGGSGSAYPIARDVLTYVFDKQKGMDILTELEKNWGGTPKERLDARYRAYSAQYGVGAPAVAPDAVQAAEAAPEPRQPIVSDAQSPAPEPDAAAPASPGPTPGTAPSPPAPSGGNPQ